MRLEDSVSGRVSPVAELKTSNTFAVVLVDRKWASAALIHMDPLGSLYPFQCGTAVTAETAGGSPPALAADAVTRAWRDMASKAPVRYSNCVLCMAPSMTRSRDASSRIAIEPPKESASAAPRVTREHLAALKEAMCTQNVSASSAVTELVVRGYRDDGGREVPDPVGAITASLEMRAHIVMTDHAILIAAMDALRRMRVRVRAVVSPCAASVANARSKVATGDVVSVEVTEDEIVGAVVSGGRIVRTLRVEAGATEVVRAAAKRLGTLSRTVSDWVSAHQDLMAHGVDETPIEAAHPPGHPPPATLGQLRESAAEATKAIAVSLRDVIGRAMPVATGWPVLVSGDDRFACRAITPALRMHGGLDALMCLPDRVHGQDMIAVPGVTRMVGALRYWSSHDTSATSLLDAYYERHASALTQAMRNAGRNADRWYRTRKAGLRIPTPVNRVISGLRALLF